MNLLYNHIKYTFKNEVSRLFFISFGIFLFILFFQPFPLDLLDFENRLLFVTGFAAITFLLSCLILILAPFFIPKIFKISEWESGPPFILNALLLILTATAYAFYIRYVGKTPLTLYIMFKVVLVCLLPVIIFVILYKNKALERIIINLKEQNKIYINKIKENSRIVEDDRIDIFSESKSDKLSLMYKNIISIKSADNYIEIYYLENDFVEKKLIRNTLKNIELQLAKKQNFIRCHRTSIVNMLYIDKLIRRYSGYSLRMSCFEEEIPVSRQYLMQIKDVISTFD